MIKDPVTLTSPLSPSISKPTFFFPSACAAYSLLMTSLGLTPLFSANTRGITSRAWANLQEIRLR